MRLVLCLLLRQGVSDLQLKDKDEWGGRRMANA